MSEVISAESTEPMTPKSEAEPFLRPAQTADIPQLLDLYEQSMRHGNTVRPGSTDWSITEWYLGKLMGEEELFCMQSPDGLVGAARLTESVNPVEWPDGNENRLLIAKLATADAVRGQGFVPKHFLPAIEDEARRRGMVGLRLNCMAENPKLMEFYGRMFKLLKLVTFDSPTKGRTITTANFQRDFEPADNLELV